ncbi:MAG: hypothetical protein ACK5UM_19725 [Pseudomonadota bacterium]|jgi:hypothetical protein
MTKPIPFRPQRGTPVVPNRPPRHTPTPGRPPVPTMPPRRTGRAAAPMPHTAAGTATLHRMAVALQETSGMTYAEAVAGLLEIAPAGAFDAALCDRDPVLGTPLLEIAPAGAFDAPASRLAS